MIAINMNSPYFKWNQNTKRKGPPYAVTFYSVEEAKAWLKRTNEENCKEYDISMPTATKVGQSIISGGKAYVNIIMKFSKELAVR